MAEIEAAVKAVSADQIIARLPDGYNSDIGEGGNTLSTGEKQLLSFARALLADPRIFVLDEATSSVDTVTERLIQNAIEKVMAGRTSFIIAHRLSTSRRKRFYERHGLQAQPYAHVQLPFQGGGPILPLVIMANRPITPEQCRAFQEYLLNRIVRYTQYHAE